MEWSDLRGRGSYGKQVLQAVNLLSHTTSPFTTSHFACSMAYGLVWSVNSWCHIPPAESLGFIHAVRGIRNVPFVLLGSASGHKYKACVSIFHARTLGCFWIQVIVNKVAMGTMGLAF